MNVKAHDFAAHTVLQLRGRRYDNYHVMMRKIPHKSLSDLIQSYKQELKSASQEIPSNLAHTNNNVALVSDHIDLSFEKVV